MKKFGIWTFFTVLLFSLTAQAKVLSEDDIRDEIPPEKRYLTGELIRLNEAIPDRGIKFCDLKNLSETSCLRKIISEQYVFDFN